MKIFLGIIWAILAVPAFLFAVIAQICDSPNGCSHSQSQLESLLDILFTISPALFALGALSAFDIFFTNKYIKYLFIFLPVVPLTAFGLFVAYYLLINPA